MFKSICQLVQGYILWTCLRVQYSIDDRTVVVFLPENNYEWNETACKYLPDYMMRKKADKAIVFHVFCHNDNEYTNSDSGVRHVFISSNKTKRLMEYYLVYKFSDRVAFLYLDYPRDNFARKVLEETVVSMDELICLGFYHLKEVPIHVSI